MRWYYDFISPYAYLQSTRLAELSTERPLTCVPVLFAGLLNHWGQLGPAEIIPKRHWTFRDVIWHAEQAGIELKLPQQHPFNPLPLLRLAIVLNNDLAAVQRIFRFVWQQGMLPQDTQAFDALLAEYNVTRADLDTPQVKQALRNNGEQALNDQVFGVPTLHCDGELFWGHQATDMALAWLNSEREPSLWPTAALAAVDNFPPGPARTVKAAATENTENEVPTTQAGATAATSNQPCLPYLPIDLAEPADVVAAVRQRRGGTLLKLDRLLLYSTPLAQGWNHLLGNVRNHFSLEKRYRELAMCVVAVVNQAEYEFSHHAPIYIECGGTEEKTRLLRLPIQAAEHEDFTQAEQAVISISLEMTRDVQVQEATFNQAASIFNNTELVELIATIAAYNMVSRFLVALNVQPTD